jgi:hypothetical protein
VVDAETLTIGITGDSRKQKVRSYENDIVATWQLRDLADSGVAREVPAQLIKDEAVLRAALENLVRCEPRVVAIDITDREYLHVGIGGRWAFVEQVVDEPWKAEVALPSDGDKGVEKPASAWFVCGGQGSEIPAKYLMPASEAIELLAGRFRQGTSPDTIQWELV